MPTCPVKTGASSLTDALRGRLGNHVDVSMPDGGLQVLVRFTPDVDDLKVREHLWQSGFHGLALSRLCIAHQERGILIGFARANPANAAKLSVALSDALRAS